MNYVKETDGSWSQTDLHLSEESELDFTHPDYTVLHELCDQPDNLDSTFVVRTLNTNQS